MANYNNLEITDFTKQKRQQIKALQDEFMTFSWRSFDAFENFGAFIINDKKGSLKFYNGPSFSNEYTKPQFEANAGELMGVTFNRNVISFTIGVYWISIEHYRLLLNWLDPLITDYICFGFEPNFRYNVKLSKIGDSTRWVVGKENGKPMYYTELNLSFEVQGVQCAKGMHPYEWGNKKLDQSGEVVINSNTGKEVWEDNWKIEEDTNKIKSCIIYLNKNVHEFIKSDLPTPLEVVNVLNIKGDDQSSPNDQNSPNAQNKNIQYTFTLKAGILESQEEIQLYKVDLENLTHFSNSSTSEFYLRLRFNSETGLLFLQLGNSTEKLLTLLTTNDSGQRIVSSYNSSKFFLPGDFEYNNFYNKTIYLRFYVDKKVDGKTGVLDEEFFEGMIENNQSTIVCFPRTNII